MVSTSSIPRPTPIPTFKNFISQTRRQGTFIACLSKVGDVKLVVGDILVNDFALDGEKRIAYLASAEMHSVLMLGLDSGELKVVVGGVGEMTVTDLTSIRLGEGGKMFVSTNGGIAGPVNGTITEGGKVAEVDIGGQANGQVGQSGKTELQRFFERLQLQVLALKMSYVGS